MQPDSSSPTLSPTKPLRCGIVGARGYSGKELAKLLLGHPSATLTAVAASESQWKLDKEILTPGASAVKTLSVAEILNEPLDFVFLATPHGLSLELAPAFYAKGVTVVDLSGAFRLPPASFQKAYGEKHPNPEAIAMSQYGLVPFAKPSTETPQIISNPGCYVTSILLALIPLLKTGAVDAKTLVIDAKSGATGGGKKAHESLLFSEVSESCLPYKVAAHQHEEEIRFHLQGFSGEPVNDLFFTPHLVPLRRGILSSMYARFKPGKTLSEAQIQEVFDKTFRNYPLLKHSAFSQGVPSLFDVAGTPFTYVFYRVRGEQLYLFSMIDNLLKGAASQALENFNVIAGLPVQTGLISYVSNKEKTE